MQKNDPLTAGKVLHLQAREPVRKGDDAGVSNAAAEVVTYPGLNVRRLWTLWAEDCIETGKARLRGE